MQEIFWQDIWISCGFDLCIALPLDPPTSQSPNHLIVPIHLSKPPPSHLDILPKTTPSSNPYLAYRNPRDDQSRINRIIQGVKPGDIQTVPKILKYLYPSSVCKLRSTWTEEGWAFG